MSKKNKILNSYTPATSVRGKKTSIGRRNVATASMNKNKRRLHKNKYRGQGKWAKDQIKGKNKYQTRSLVKGGMIFSILRIKNIGKKIIRIKISEV